MIVAAANAAQGLGPPPEELLMAWRCEKWGLPEGKGWLDEPAGLVDRMSAALNVYNAVRAWRSRPRDGEAGKNWFRDNAETWKLVQMALDLREELGRNDA